MDSFLITFVRQKQFENGSTNKTIRICLFYKAMLGPNTNSTTCMPKYMDFLACVFGFYMWDLLVYSTKNHFQRSPIFHLLSSWKRSFYNSLLIHFLSLLDSFPITFVCQKSWKIAAPLKLSGYVYFTKLCWGQILI